MHKKRFSSTQGRVTAAFTLLFLVGVIILTLFLKTSADAIAYNAAARAAYVEARQFYTAKEYLQQFERTLNKYELTSDYDTRSQYYSSYAKLQQFLVTATANAADPEEEARLKQLTQDLASLRAKFDLIIAAVDAEDWDKVIALDKDAYTLVKPIFAQIDVLIQARTDMLAGLRSEVQTFATLGWLSILAALPIFLLLVGFVTVTFTRQLHAPLIVMTDELKNIAASRFDPAALGNLPERHNEIGYLAREYLTMASAVQTHQANLQKEAEEIKTRIR